MWAALLPLLLALCVEAVPVTVPPASELPPADERFSGPQDPNPEVKATWEMVHRSPLPAINLALVPGKQDAFLFLGRNRPKGMPLPPGQGPIPVVGVYDLPTDEFTNISSVSNTFCSAIVPTHDGKLFIAGGHGQAMDTNNVTDGKKHFRLYDYDEAKDFLGFVGSMEYNRWYPTQTLLPNRKIMIYGGSLATNENAPSAAEYEVWDPAEPAKMPLEAHMVEPDFLTAVIHNFYACNFVLPTGDVYSQLDGLVRFYKPDGTWRTKADGTYLNIPGFPEDIETQYPRSGTCVMTGLTHENDYGEVEVVVFGGVSKDNTCAYGLPDNSRMTSRKSYRVKISWTMEGEEPAYTFSDWVEEDMIVARSGGDATLLPNGDVVIVNGVQAGCSGGSLAGARRNLYPAFWPVLYQPDKPEGERYTVMKATGIPRMYHGTSALTLDGKLFVSGCDACQASVDQFLPYLGSGESFYERNTVGNYELRNEVFSPPYVFDTEFMPEITGIADTTDATAITDTTYDAELTVTWKSKEDGAELVNVTSVSLVAPSAATHGFNNNQRVVFLEILESTMDGEEGSLTVKLPPKPEIAPPQMYLLFLNNGKTYGRAWWVHLKDGA